MITTNASLDFGLRKLLAYLVPQATGLTGLHALSGGASQETWAFNVQGLEDETPLILRRTGAGSAAQLSDSPGMEAEAMLIELARAAGVPVPGVRYVLRPEDGLGSGFIMDRIQGETIARKILRDPQFDAIRPTLACACGGYMARIHGIKRELLPPLPVVSASGEVERYLGIYHHFKQPRPVFELAFRWLQDNAPSDEHAQTLVHGDFRNGNLIIGPDGLRAVLDWELAHIGDPMEDLGWICVNSWRFGNIDFPVGGFGSREELFAGYEAQSGKRVDPERVKFWQVLGTIKWGLMCQMMAETFQNGVMRSVERAAIGRRSSETEIDLLCLLAPRTGE